MTVRLGIVVVYMAEDDQQALLELHLGRIARHTAVPYTIHGVAARLAPGCRQRLEQSPNLRLHDLAPTELRRSGEHSYYLEQLVRAAVDDGATHVVTLHLDSFPVRDGWVDALVGTLSDSCAFATIEGINTACLLFHRDFYHRYRPAFRLTPAEQASRQVESYVRERRPHRHSGVGYGLRAWENGMRWHEMRVSGGRADASGDAIYDDLIFHLGGAMRLTGVPVREMPGLVRQLGPTRFESILRVMRMIAPQPLRRWLRVWLKSGLAALIDRPRSEWRSEAMIMRSARLLANPDVYIEALREQGAT
jgi:hypothetical protein